MTLQELKDEISKYQYFEDTNIIDVSLASIIATRLKLGDPIWLVVIGASSGGKSQILRPLSLTDPKFLHRVDDLTESTFLSGGKIAGGGDPSLLNRIGPQGMIVLSDLTVLFSKNPESRNAILSQFRMIYDGEMTKFIGTSMTPLHWKGYLGVLAASTPSIYAHFEEVADMGERFIYYRMKDYSADKAVDMAMNRTEFGKGLDDKLSKAYDAYIKEIIGEFEAGPIALPPEMNSRIKEISIFAERVRTAVHVDYKNIIIRLPTPAMPMRVALQLTSVAKALYIMRKGALTENDMVIIDWCGYSLANEEKRACLRMMAGLEFNTSISTATVAAHIGLHTSIVSNIMHNLLSTGIVSRSGGERDGGGGHTWRIKIRKDWETVRRIEGITGSATHEEETFTSEDGNELAEIADELFDKM